MQIFPFVLIYAKICGIFIIHIKSKLVKNTEQRPKTANLLSLECDLTVICWTHLQPLYIVGDRPVINTLICTKHYTTAFCSIPVSIYMRWFFNEYKLDFCNNLSTAVVYLGATHKHDPVCQPQGVFKRHPWQPSENAPLPSQQSFLGMQTNSQRKQIWTSTG